MTLVIFLAALIGGMLIGLPICFALLFSGVCMMLYLNGFNAQILSQNLFSGADSFSMMAVPFFIMAGEFMNRGGITKRIVNAANAIIGHVRGGLGYVAIMAILLFASMIGSAVASTAFLGAILIPMMVRAGYKRDTCTGLIAAGNNLSPIMPPSVPMIIFGVQAGVSVTKLFMGGIAPAVYLSGALCVLFDVCISNDWMAWANRFSPITLAQINTYSGINLKYHITLKYGILFFIIGILVLSILCVLVNYKENTEIRLQKLEVKWRKKQ